MTEILAVWFGVMILIAVAIGLTAIMAQIFNIFFKYFELASKEKSLSKKIKYYAISFAMVSLFALMIVTLVMI